MDQLIALPFELFHFGANVVHSAIAGFEAGYEQARRAIQNLRVIAEELEDFFIPGQETHTVLVSNCRRKRREIRL
jgi:hypothetical protein